MPVYLAPGVYVEEVPSTPPIVGVGTSTAAIVGEVDDAPPFEMPFRPGRPLDPLYIVPQDRFDLVSVDPVTGTSPAVLVTNLVKLLSNTLERLVVFILGVTLNAEGDLRR